MANEQLSRQMRARARQQERDKPKKPKIPPPRGNKPDPKRPPKKGFEREDGGGETVTVQVYVNGRLRFKRCASITGSKGPQVRRYKLDNGEVLNFRRSLGFKRLARLLLNQ